MQAAVLWCGLLTMGMEVEAPRVELLWPKGGPDAVGKEAADQPSVTIYLPPAEKATGAAVVICPGGGYAGHAMAHEGKDPADWLTARGVAAFVLKYRLGQRYKHPIPLQDAQRALRL